MRAVRLAAAILCGTSTSLAFAQATSETELATQQVESKQVATAPSRSLLLGVDANGNGIRDDIEAIVAKNSASQDSHTKDAEQAATEIEEQPHQKASIVAKTPKTRKPQQPRNGCFEYLLREPKDRYEADLRNRQRTNGMPGTHPCDPVVSPLRERPYETEYVQIGPVIVRP